MSSSDSSRCRRTGAAANGKPPWRARGVLGSASGDRGPGRRVFPPIAIKCSFHGCTSSVQLIGAHRRKLALGVHRDRRYTEARGNHRRDREQAHPRRHLALLMVGSQSKGGSFENGTAFSAVAPSWLLARSRLSIVLPITRPSQEWFTETCEVRIRPRRKCISAPRNETVDPALWKRGE